MPPASAVNNNSSNATAQAAAKAEHEKKLRGALKDFIQKERQRKQEEYEAKCEEIRLRKEREARERENDMTLEDTRSQILQLDTKLEDLHNQKQQLFLQLKKVLNDDETRKKQQKDNELFAMQQALQANLTAQIFIPHMQLAQKPIGNQSVKRGRSPSPPSQAFYKTTFGQTKHDEGRRGADYARILWNKNANQYPGTGTLFYQAASTVPTTQHDGRLQPLYPYQLPLRPGYHLELQSAPTVPVSKSDSPGHKAPTQVFHINLDQPDISQADVLSLATNSVTTSKPQITMEKINERYHIEVKHDGTTTGQLLGIPHVSDGVIYKPLLTEIPQLQQNVLQIATNMSQNPKTTGSITQGFAPGRSNSAQHTQELPRQQISVVSSQAGQQVNQQQQQQQPVQYRRLF